MCEQQDILHSYATSSTAASGRLLHQRLSALTKSCKRLCKGPADCASEEALLQQSGPGIFARPSCMHLQAENRISAACLPCDDMMHMMHTLLHCHSPDLICAISTALQTRKKCIPGGHASPLRAASDGKQPAKEEVHSQADTPGSLSCDHILLSMRRCCHSAARACTRQNHLSSVVVVHHVLVAVAARRGVSANTIVVCDTATAALHTSRGMSQRETSTCT